MIYWLHYLIFKHEKSVTHINMDMHMLFLFSPFFHRIIYVNLFANKIKIINSRIKIKSFVLYYYSTRGWKSSIHYYLDDRQVNLFKNFVFFVSSFNFEKLSSFNREFQSSMKIPESFLADRTTTTFDSTCFKQFFILKTMCCQSLYLEL